MYDHKNGNFPSFRNPVMDETREITADNDSCCCKAKRLHLMLLSRIIYLLFIWRSCQHKTTLSSIHVINRGLAVSTAARKKRKKIHNFTMIFKKLTHSDLCLPIQPAFSIRPWKSVKYRVEELGIDVFIWRFSWTFQERSRVWALSYFSHGVFTVLTKTIKKFEKTIK